MFPRKAPKQDLVMCVRIREYIKTAEDVAVAVILNKVSQFFLQFVYCLTSSCSKSTHRAMKSLRSSPLFCRLKVSHLFLFTFYIISVKFTNIIANN